MVTLGLKYMSSPVVASALTEQGEGAHCKCLPGVDDNKGLQKCCIFSPIAMLFFRRVKMIKKKGQYLLYSENLKY